MRDEQWEEDNDNVRDRKEKGPSCKGGFLSEGPSSHQVTVPTSKWPALILSFDQYTSSGYICVRHADMPVRAPKKKSPFLGVKTDKKNIPFLL
jgi:hypothetical protein